MNLNIYLMSLRQHKKSTVLWTLTLALLIVLGMAFYPPISQSLSEIEVIFENPMMKGMLNLFAVGPDQLGSLSGFYMTYASIYVILIGGIFAMMTAVSDVGGELRDKTFEYLLTKPVKRWEVLVSKTLAILSRIMLVTVGLCLTTLLSFAFFSKDAPLQYHTSESALKNVRNVIEDNPQGVQYIWTLDDKFFMGWLVDKAYASLPSRENVQEDIELDDETIRTVLNRLERDPYAFFDEILENPSEHMQLFGIPENQRSDFIEGVKETRQAFDDMKERFYSDPSFLGQMFSSQPEYFLRQIKSSESLETFKTVFPSAQKDIDVLVSPYKVKDILVFHTYLFFFMVVLSAMGVCLSVCLKNPKNIVTIGTGLVLFLYFLSTIMKISQTTSAYVWMTPFGLIDQAMGRAMYRLKAFNIGLLTAEAVFLFGLSIALFEKKDI
ncbi:ABC transporter permease subunit [Fusibacter sp. JL216-2]|uniref:ABC transporter permease subunit n=1 Tax=Fusibacter sp. JL216-2 TaxID=3071453 RepID=UPI003D3410C2